jgi:hypothetical protein
MIGAYPAAPPDQRGPATNPIGWKVIRGGAWEAFEFDCRSASRWFEAASPFISDFIISFRVVLVSDPQTFDRNPKRIAVILPRVATLRGDVPVRVRRRNSCLVLRTVG